MPWSAAHGSPPTVRGDRHGVGAEFSRRGDAQRHAAMVARHNCRQRADRGARRAAGANSAKRRRLGARSRSSARRRHACRRQIDRPQAPFAAIHLRRCQRQDSRAQGFPCRSESRGRCRAKRSGSEDLRPHRHGHRPPQIRRRPRRVLSRHLGQAETRLARAGEPGGGAGRNRYAAPRAGPDERSRGALRLQESLSDDSLSRALAGRAGHRQFVPGDREGRGRSRCRRMVEAHRRRVRALRQRPRADSQIRTHRHDQSPEGEQHAR